MNYLGVAQIFGGVGVYVYVFVLSPLLFYGYVFTVVGRAEIAQLR